MRSRDPVAAPPGRQQHRLGLDPDTILLIPEVDRFFAPYPHALHTLRAHGCVRMRLTVFGGCLRRAAAVGAALGCGRRGAGGMRRCGGGGAADWRFRGGPGCGECQSLPPQYRRGKATSRRNRVRTFDAISGVAASPFGTTEAYDREQERHNPLYPRLSEIILRLSTVRPKRPRAAMWITQAEAASIRCRPARACPSSFPTAVSRWPAPRPGPCRPRQSPDSDQVRTIRAQHAAPCQMRLSSLTAGAFGTTSGHNAALI